MISAYWDAAAGSFDDEPDHGLRDPHVRAAWAGRLDAWLPGPPADVVDLGCGTGSLSVLMAGRGHRVMGVDLAPDMAGQARRKLAAAGYPARVVVGDAADPPIRAGGVDVVLARHLVWTLPDPDAALRRWAALPRPGGRLVLVEGRWGTGDGYVKAALPWDGGVTAEVLAETLRPHVADLRVEPLPDPALWGRTITDERYAVIAMV